MASVVQQAEMLVGETELWFGGRGPGCWEMQGKRPDQYILVWVDDVDHWGELQVLSE